MASSSFSVGSFWESRIGIRSSGEIIILTPRTCFFIYAFKSLTLFFLSLSAARTAIPILLRASLLANSAFASCFFAFLSSSSATFLTFIFFFARASEAFIYSLFWKLSRMFSLALWRLTCALREFWISSSCKLPSIRWFLVALIITVYSLRGEELKVSRILLLRLSRYRTHSLYEDRGFGRVGNWYIASNS